MTREARYGVAIVLSAVLFVLIDSLCVAHIFLVRYRRLLAGRLRTHIRRAPAGLFYVLHACALVFLATLPSLDQPHGVAMAAARGALLGGATYGTYALTVYAILEDWPLELAAADCAYGTLLGASVSALSVALARLV